MEDFSVDDLETTDPNKTIKITADGVEVKQDREMVADVDGADVSDFSKGDRIDVLIECPEHGWQIHHQLPIQDVRENEAIVKKQDGFHTRVPAHKIPIEQSDLNVQQQLQT